MKDVIINLIIVLFGIIILSVPVIAQGLDCTTPEIPDYPEYYEMINDTYLCPNNTYIGEIKITCSDCFLDCQGATFGLPEEMEFLTRNLITSWGNDNVEIRNCGMQPGRIRLLFTNNSLVINNSVLINRSQTIFREGISVSGYSYNNVVKGNEVHAVFGGSYGILPAAGSNNKIIQNTVTGWKYGISPRWGAFNTTVENNTVYNNEHGIKPYHGSSGAYIINNLVFNGTSDGIWIVESQGSYQLPTDTIVINNTVYNSKFCLKVTYLTPSYNLLLDGNVLSKCAYGFTVLNYFWIVSEHAPSYNRQVTSVVRNNDITTSSKVGILINKVSGISFYRNNIINRVQVFDFGGNNIWNTTDTGNYWSDYDTKDEGCFEGDGDGNCDTPYPIINHSDIIVGYDYLPSHTRF